MLRKQGIFLTTLLLIPGAFTASATHLRAGQITARRLDCDTRTFLIRIVVYTNDYRTTALFGGDDDILDFGDGSDPDKDGRPGILVPPQRNIRRPDLGEHVAMATFEIEWTYSGESTFIISYSEPFRNEGVLNMDGSGATRFYLETQITLDPYFGCNKNTPFLEVEPIDIGCTHVAWSHNPSAADLDEGDSLSYELAVPFRERNTTVVNYRAPDDASFYNDFPRGDETGTKPPDFDIDTQNGTISWDAPGSAGEYNIAFLIKEWRKIDGKWEPMGFVRRDMQIIIEECENKRPDLIVPEEICVVAGTTIKKTILGIDPDNDNVKIEAFSVILEKTFPSHATASIDKNDPDAPNDFQPSVPPAELFFEWKTECSHIREQAYQVVFKITDDPPAGPRLVTFKTWRITVIGPPPVLQTATALPNESAQITWQEYVCGNAEKMQIWRRVDNADYDLDSCVTGMPSRLGYELIAERGIDDPDGVPDSFIDTNNGEGLAGGALYCYRIVALFPLPKGGKSYVSNEVCVEIPADEPVIINVTVNDTHDSQGKIKLKWIRPFDLDTTLVELPYTYKIYRSEGFTQSDPQFITAITSKADTAAIVDTGLNTLDLVYNYQVLAVDKFGNLIDTSSVASSVRAKAESQLNKIHLTWQAEIPWSIQVPGRSHRVFRVEAQEEALPVTFADFKNSTSTLFQTDVDVTSKGLQFFDQGPLETEKFYCYVVETIGTYGSDDPLITSLEPFHNFSQIICAQPGDSIPPCKPNPPELEAYDCNDPLDPRVACNANQFKNKLTWTATDDPDCGANDIAYYLVYYSRTVNGTFVEIQDQNNNPVKVYDDSYEHSRNLTSFAGCYKIAAVDRSGNISEPSDASCTDNCPNYMLPNVFSPNGDLCNNVFSAYGNISRLQGEESSQNCIATIDRDRDREWCARYVLKVDFAVFNRWGKKVYDYQSDFGNEDQSIYINWDGRASNGAWLESGIYYYSAVVTFDTSDPARREKHLKGWIHLIR